MKALTRDDILQFDDLILDKVATPEWGKDSFVYVKALTGSERDWFESTFTTDDGTAERLNNFRAKLCCKTICDENGKNLFTERDIVALGAKNARPIDRIFSKGLAMSGIDKEAIDGAEDFFDETPANENGTT